MSGGNVPAPDSSRMHNERINLLADMVQNHVKVQPWGYYGTEPVPLEIFFNKELQQPWTVKYVIELNIGGKTRKWAFANGKSLEEALQGASRMQQQAKRLKEREI